MRESPIWSKLLLDTLAREKYVSHDSKKDKNLLLKIILEDFAGPFTACNGHYGEKVKEEVESQEKRERESAPLTRMPEIHYLPLLPPSPLPTTV